MSEYNIYAGPREPHVSGVGLVETLAADLEAAFGITFYRDTDGPLPICTWGDRERWLSFCVSAPPDLDEPHYSHPARITAQQPDSDAWAHEVFDALEATGRYSLFMLEDHCILLRTNSEQARTQWEEAQTR